MANRPPQYQQIGENVNGDVNKKKDAFFNMTVTTFKGTPEWKLLVFFIMSCTLFLTFSNIYFMEEKDMPLERKLLAVMCCLSACMSIVFLSHSQRNGAEADKMEQFAKETTLYDKNIIITLQGSGIFKVFLWVCFVIFAIGFFVIFWWIPMPILQRNFLYVCGLLLFSATFLTVKTMRDSIDGDKWDRGYNGHQHAE